MSKYRIETQPSKYRQRLIGGTFSLLLASLWLWQPQSLPGQVWIQIVLSMVLLWMAVRIAAKASPSRVFSISEEGQWQWLDAQEETMQVNPASRITSWMLWIRLESNVSNRRNWVWIYRDSVQYADFRRLCRILQRCLRPVVTREQHQ
ncbi:protein YgfX [Bowmanella dokdonensis]|uniref:Uncharacterized protein n=1 Tax=Bowmanella dokdonensis TaxID=751969 RepID=A0A939DR82_9ALTE|nr:hypothetical protein [Bowmanella dokdonensis]